MFMPKHYMMEIREALEEAKIHFDAHEYWLNKAHEEEKREWLSPEDEVEEYIIETYATANDEREWGIARLSHAMDLVRGLFDSGIW